jgi:PTH1 family peptidyl-tRNA hydrolase
MKLIVGLGNPGQEYQDTRHNIGFMVVDRYVKDSLPVTLSTDVWESSEKFTAEICQINNNLVAKPQTFMNLIGLSVVKIANFYKIEPADIWVIHDDIDLPLGKIRIRVGGASAGHHGVDSIISHLGTADFLRFRLGIGRGKLDMSKSSDINLHARAIEKFVISPFSYAEKSTVRKMIKRCSEAIGYTLEQGLEKAKNKYN